MAGRRGRGWVGGDGGTEEVEVYCVYGCWAGLQLAVVCLFVSQPSLGLPWRWSQLPINLSQLSQLVRNTTPPHRMLNIKNN